MFLNNFFPHSLPQTPLSAGGEGGGTRVGTYALSIQFRENKLNKIQLHKSLYLYIKKERFTETHEAFTDF